MNGRHHGRLARWVAIRLLGLLSTVAGAMLLLPGLADGQVPSMTKPTFSPGARGYTLAWTQNVPTELTIIQTCVAYTHCDASWWTHLEDSAAGEHQVIVPWSAIGREIWFDFYVQNGQWLEPIQPIGPFLIPPLRTYLPVVGS